VRACNRGADKEQQKARRIPIGVFIGTILFGLVRTGVAELMAAATFRRSFVLNLFGIAIVHGIATRKRLMARWATASLPLLVLSLIAVLILTDQGTLPFLSAARGAVGVSGAFS
jgi:hypothetical protein